ncbi:MAG TPA: ATP-binding protein, partial [Vicinamibacterales bacterium]|nr:ATP-binding protein [Vicinamibacterales bacterium]
GAPPRDPATFDQDHVRLMTDKLSAKVAELEAKRQRLAAVAGIIERVSHQQETVALFERFASDARAVIAVEAVVVLIGDGPDSLRVVATSGSRDSSTGHTLEVPLASPSFRYGVVRFAGRLGQEGFTDEDRAIAASLASALSVAYENILRYEALRNHAAELEHRVAERTAELKRSNEDLEQFAYVASHDLQEPLRMVASYTQLLAKRYHGRLDADADEFIHFAVDGATRMQTLIHDLLAYSRVGARGGVERFAVDEAVDAAIANLVDAIAASGGSIVREPLPTIATDPTKLTQLFQNLIGNALKFSRKGVPPAIRVGARRCDAGWAFSVADNGIGIEPQYAERVFVIFQRLHTRAQYEGTGIGLALCKRIVTGFGGRIWLESTPGEGSTFFFTVPDSQER